MRDNTRTDFRSIEDAAKHYAGIWGSVFSYWSEYNGLDYTEEDLERYGFYFTYGDYVRSDLVYRSNHEVMAAELRKYKDFNTFYRGYANYFIIPVYTPKGRITACFRRFYEMLEAIDEYPLLDEEHHSRLCEQVALENITDAMGYALRDYVLPSDAAEQLIGQWYESEVYNDYGESGADGEGFYPTDEELVQWADELCWRKNEESTADYAMRIAPHCGLIVVAVSRQLLSIYVNKSNTYLGSRSPSSCVDFILQWRKDNASS